MISTLIHVLIIILICGLIFMLLWWALTQFPLPPPIAQVCRAILILIFILIVIGLLLPLAGIKL